MPATPDKLDTIIALLLDVKSALLAFQPAEPPAPPVADEATTFLERWKRVPHEEAAAKYGVMWPTPIQPMPSYDEAEAIYRARAGYATNGYPSSSVAWAKADGPIGIIAHATQATASSHYETGYGLCDPDVAAYGWYVGIFKPFDELAGSFGVGTQPRDYAGKTLASMLAVNFGRGGPGVG